MPDGTRAAVAVLLGIALIVGFIWLLVALSHAARPQYKRSGWALLGLAVLIFGIGLWLWPVWFLLIIVPIVGWYVMKPQIPETRWDEMARREGSTPMSPEEETKWLDRGRCPSCGAKNAAEAERCHVCGSMLEAI